MVWREPLSRLAPELGVSDVGLAKICDRLEIPRPPAGHWIRRRHGRPGRKPPLAMRSDLPAEVELEPKERRRPQAEAPSVTVPERLARPHGVVRDLRAGLGHAREDDEGMLRSSDTAILRVSKRTKGRALRILDAVLKTFEKRGHRVDLRQARDRRELAIVVAGTPVSLRLRERLVQHEHEPTARERDYARRGLSHRNPRHDLRPSGRLVFELDTYLTDGLQKSWGDTARRALEARLGALIVGTEAVAEVHRRVGEERERERIEAERRRELAAEAARREERERRRVDALCTVAERWEHAGRIRRFLTAITEAAGHVSGVSELVRWGGAVADRLDPLAETASLFELLETASAAKVPLLEESEATEAADESALRSPLVEEAQELGGLGEGAEGFALLRKLADPEREGDHGERKQIQDQQDRRERGRVASL